MAVTLGIYALPVKAQLPWHMSHAFHMKATARSILAENLANLMKSDEAHPISQAELGRRTKNDQRNIGRILKGDISTTLDTLESLAAQFDLQAWQLLVPGLDPKNPPVNHITDAEKRLYERLRDAAHMVMDAQEPHYRK